MTLADSGSASTPVGAAACAGSGRPFERGLQHRPDFGSYEGPGVGVGCRTDQVGGMIQSVLRHANRRE